MVVFHDSQSSEGIETKVVGSKKQAKVESPVTMFYRDRLRRARKLLQKQNEYVNSTGIKGKRQLPKLVRYNKPEMSVKMEWNQPLPQYPFVQGDVQRLRYDDPQAMTLIKQQVPVILTDADLVQPAMKWTMEYLSQNIGEGTHSVYINPSTCMASTATGTTDQCNGVLNGNISSYTDSSPSRFPSRPPEKSHNLFKYYDLIKAIEYSKSFTPPTTKVDMTFSEFLDRFYGSRESERVYFQQRLNNTVGKHIAADFVQFNWKWLVHWAQEWAWGPLTSNLLLIGQKGNITPCHYDEQQNLFCQLQGRKRIFLFSPENFPNLYPYPVHHPHDRQSQVDFDYPDYDRFPKLQDLQGLEAVVHPGEILYIPMYWWHHVINLDDTIAINFWHKDPGNAAVEYPLKAHQKVAVVRNMEKMLLQAVKEQDDLTSILHWLVDGRY